MNKIYDSLSPNSKATVNSILDKVMGSILDDNDKVNVNMLKAVLEQLNAEKQNLKAQIKADNDAIKAAECEIEVGSGNLQADALFANELEINIAAGNVNITLDGAKDDFNYNLSCALGNIVLGKTESDSGFDNNCVIKNNAKNDVAINCAAGNIEVYFTK